LSRVFHSKWGEPKIGGTFAAKDKKVSGTVSEILALFSHFVDEGQIKDRHLFVDQRLFLGYDLARCDD
jgi:hypothetical protein